MLNFLYECKVERDAFDIFYAVFCFLKDVLSADNYARIKELCNKNELYLIKVELLQQ